MSKTSSLTGYRKSTFNTRKFLLFQSLSSQRNHYKIDARDKAAGKSILFRKINRDLSDQVFWDLVSERGNCVVVYK
jgi:hypothetical protein